MEFFDSGCILKQWNSASLPYNENTERLSYFEVQADFLPQYGL